MNEPGKSHADHYVQPASSGKLLKLKRSIVVQFTMDGFHHYKDAPTQVSFLRASHRHLFHFRLQFRVDDANRELEFFIQAAKVKAYLKDTFGEPCNFDQRSCEMIAEALLVRFYPIGCYKVDVFEDGENGGVAEIEQEKAA